MKSGESHQRELLLVKVKKNNGSATEISEIAARFNGRIVDEGATSLTVEAIGTTKELEALLKSLQSYGIRELAQSGLIAMEIGDKTLVERTLSETGLASSESHSQTADYQN